MNRREERTAPATRDKTKRTLVPIGDPCPQCGEADLEPRGGKHACPICNYLQPCCQP